MRQQIIGLIFDIAKSASAFDLLETALRDVSSEQLSASLIECGILPEVF